MFPTTNQNPSQPFQFQPQPPQIPQLPQPPFVGVLVPGGAVRTDAVPVDASGLKYSLGYVYPRDFPPQTPLAAVTEIVAFLIQPQPTQQSPPVPVLPPPDHGVLLYWQISANGGASSTGFELLGDAALTWDRPSAVLSTKWGEHEHIVEASSQQSNLAELQITIGLSIEPLATITNLLGDGNVGTGASIKARSMERRLLVAQNVARDLFRYMQSFDTGAAGNQQQMVVPTNVFDRWFQRFTNRFQRDPNFFMKRQNDGET